MRAGTRYQPAASTASIWPNSGFHALFPAHAEQLLQIFDGGTEWTDSLEAVRRISYL